MRVHRTPAEGRFSVVHNHVAQDRSLSMAARGLLVDLLSRADDWHDDIRTIAASGSDGRCAVGRALAELKLRGYYLVVRRQREDGRWESEAHVFDTPQTGAKPQVEPRAPRPAAGAVATGTAGAQPSKNLEKEPTPLPLAAPPPEASGDGRRWRRAVSVLFRVLGPRPDLCRGLGQREAVELAPLVDAWLERGLGVAELSKALLDGLPQPVFAPKALLANRLRRKLPPAHVAPPDRRRRAAKAAAAPPPWFECPGCCRATRSAAPCADCATGAPRPDPWASPEAVAYHRDITERGMAQVRAACAVG